MALHCNETKLLIIMYSNTLFLSQPAKLAEAFKYFVQGMGYSKYWHYGMVHAASKVCWVSKHAESLLNPDVLSFPCWICICKGNKNKPKRQKKNKLWCLEEDFLLQIMLLNSRQFYR